MRTASPPVAARRLCRNLANACMSVSPFRDCVLGQAHTARDPREEALRPADISGCPAASWSPNGVLPECSRGPKDRDRSGQENSWLLVLAPALAGGWRKGAGGTTTMVSRPLRCVGHWWLWSGLIGPGGSDGPESESPRSGVPVGPGDAIPVGNIGENPWNLACDGRP